VTREVDFTYGLSTWGDVQVIARVTPGRPAPLAGSEESRLDPPEPAEVELLHVRVFDDHDQAHELLRYLKPEDLDEVRRACLDEAQRLEENGEE
jgi:hypothetical protein